MIDDRELTRLLNSWYGEGPTRAPSGLVGAVAGRIGRVSQRSSWRFGRRSRRLDVRTLAVAAGAAAFVVAVTIGLRSLWRQPPTGEASPTPASSAATPSPSPTFVPGPETPPTSNGITAAVPPPLGMLPPGRYTSQTFVPALTYLVPAGWTNAADDPERLELTSRSGSADLRIEIVANVYPRCTLQGRCLPDFDPDEPHSAKDLADRAVGQPGLANGPSGVSIGGLNGWVVDQRGPHGIGMMLVAYPASGPPKSLDTKGRAA